MNTILINSLLVGGGAVFGAITRYIFTLFIPFPILVVNVIGSLVIGYTTAKFSAQQEWLMLVNIGFLGALTTFSSFSLKVVKYIYEGEFIQAGSYILFSVFICVFACYFGYKLGS